MPAIAVVGAQWGDEGKGKVVHLLSSEADFVVRFNGGANAGHTLVLDEAVKTEGVKPAEVEGREPREGDHRRVVLHLLPVGIVHKGKKNLVGPYVVCDPEIIRRELALAKEIGSEVYLDPRAGVVLPIHKLIDGGREVAAGGDAIGTTKQGIGPCYEDYHSRRGLRLGCFESADKIREALERGRYYEEKLALARFLGVTDAPSLDQTIEWAVSFMEAIKPLLEDTVHLVHQALRDKRLVVFEGGQGIGLDIIHGTRPNQTASNCGAGGIFTSFGPIPLERVIGVTKGYATRVGSGTLPCEMDEADDEAMRDAGGEFGATTARARRCGWLHLPTLKRSCEVAGITELYVTKLDVLGTTFPEFRVGVDNGYIKLPGWGARDRFRGANIREHLPDSAKIFLDIIERYTGLDVTGIGTGPARSDIIIWKRD